MATLNSNIPAGPLAQKWEKYKFSTKLINPANKRKYKVIVVGAGLAGASRRPRWRNWATRFTTLFSTIRPRRAHSVAAQGGINAAKNYQNDGDSVHRLFYDTIKGGDFRAREANVHRLAEVSVNIIDQCAAQGVPFAREYGGLLDNRSFGGAQVSRTFYARGQTGQQLLLGAYSALCRKIANGGVKSLHPLGDARSRGRGRPREGHHRPQSADRRDHAAQRRRRGAGDGRLRQRLQSFHLRARRERHGHLARLQARRVLRQSVLHADSSDVHSGQRRLPVQAHADERVVAQRRPGVGAEEEGRLQKEPGRDRGGRSRLLSGADVFRVRQSRAPRHRQPRGQDGVRRRSRRRRDRAWAFIWISPRRFSVWAKARCASVTATCSRCITRSRTKTPITRRCAFIPPCITRWAACGWTTT